MEDFKLSNSKLIAWETLCPLKFKALYIDKTLQRDPPTLPMELGNWFETLCIGGGIRGAFDFTKSEFGTKIQNGVYFDRVHSQAKAYERYKDALGGKIIKRQSYLTFELRSNDGRDLMLLEGTLDIEYDFLESEHYPAGPGVIDLKMTGDAENNFGDKFAWGAPEKMDLSQIKTYTKLTQIKHKMDFIPRAEYWVFDTSKEMKQSLIQCRISEYAMFEHVDRLFKAYDEITTSIATNDWEVKNTWSNCSQCKVQGCKWRRTIPEYNVIEL